MYKIFSPSAIWPFTVRFLSDQASQLLADNRQSDRCNLHGKSLSLPVVALETDIRSHRAMRLLAACTIPLKLVILIRRVVVSAYDCM